MRDTDVSGKCIVFIESYAVRAPESGDTSNAKLVTTACDYGDKYLIKK